MTIYITYQCSVCRRLKDLPKDSNRALPNLCTITKGCDGRIFPIRETATADVFSPAPVGLENWYPRGTQIDKPVQQQIPNTIDLSTSSIGTLSLAVKGVQANRIKVKFSEKKLEDINYQQFIFKIPTVTDVVPVIDGVAIRDSYGKLLDFSDAAVSEKRIFVLVDGVPRFVGSDPQDISQLANSRVYFNSEIPAGSTVSVLIYDEKNTKEKTITFDLNSARPTRYGAWQNIAIVRDLNFKEESTPDPWYVYSCESVTTVEPNSRIEIQSIMDVDGNNLVSKNNLDTAIFLLAKNPYTPVDRYYNFCVNLLNASTSFLISSVSESGIIKLKILDNEITEIFPPLKINTGDYHTPDVISQKYQALDVFQLNSEKILGPI